MRTQKAVLKILAGLFGVYEVAVRAPADQYDKADRLSAAIQPAVAIIDKAIAEVYGQPRRPGEYRK